MSKFRITFPKLKIITILLVIINIGLMIRYFYYRYQYSLSSKPTPLETAIANYRHPLLPRVTSNILPQIQAKNYILLDNDSNTVILSRGSHERVYPASTTKLATALTALNIYPLDETITVPESYKEGKVMDLQVGEKITVKSLVSALLIYSANDSAFNLASHHSQGVAGFVSAMNLLAKKYQLNDTNFINFDGNHHPDHYSSVYDLAQLGRLSIKNPVVREVIKQKELTVTDISGENSHHLISTNELLGVIPEVEGIKTGWTPEAGGCFVGLLKIKDHYLISVVAQSPDRFVDTKTLISWAKSNLDWVEYQP